MTNNDLRPEASTALEALFAPRRIALVGASEDEGKVGTIFMRNLVGYDGEVIPVTKSRDTVMGRQAYPNLRDIPGPVDLCVVVVPAPAVPAIIDDAAASGVATVLVISGGFAEAGEEGARLQGEVLSAARQGGVRIVGPNCFGVLNCNNGLNASMAIGTPAAGGRIALATQSGAYGMAIYTLSEEHDLRFSKVFAAGNKVDLTECDLVPYLGQDPETDVICLFLEAFDDGATLFEQARSISLVKPIIVTKVGRTDAGARAALSHTASIAARSPVWASALEQAGVLVARTGLEMVDAAKAVAWQPIPQGARVGIITNSGGTGVELTDLLADEGVSVPELSDELQAALGATIPPFGSARNPVDITTDWRRFATLYADCIELLARSGEVDVIVPILLQRSALDPDVATGIEATVSRLRADDVLVPVFVCWVAPRAAQPNCDLLQQARIPCFDWPYRTARAVALACRYGETKRRPTRGNVQPLQLERSLPGGVLGASEAADLARAAGLTLPEQEICATREDAITAATRVGYPVVLKLASDRVTHKSDVGGVRIGLADESAVADAAVELLQLDPDACLLVQEQVQGVELIVGAYRDSEFGPVVLVGLGGTAAEVLADVQFLLAPVDEAEALAALARLRGFALLDGYRGQSKVAVDEVARAVSAVSQLAVQVPSLQELDVNPLIVTSERAVAVDVRVVLSLAN